MADPTVIEFDAKNNGNFEISCPALAGKSVRMTIEEIPNKCCDKWRFLCFETIAAEKAGESTPPKLHNRTLRFTPMRDQLDGSSYTQVKIQRFGAGAHGSIIFCPECGRKL